jgi:molecular chaperone Hsp33
MTQASHDCDTLTRFLLDGAGVRGVHVCLDSTWQQIRARASSAHENPPLAAMELLGEATAAAALFTGHTKLNGRLSVQLRGDGPLRTLFAECTSIGTLRGIAQFEEDAEVSRDLRALGPDAVLAITIENAALEGHEPMRYQGMVALDSDSLAGAFEDYFRQSEQLPTRLLLVSDGDRASGLMLQKLPGDSGDEDGWTRVNALFDTLTIRELRDWPVASLLHRLFHQDDARILGQRPLAFGCSCSRERVAAMLQSLGGDEAMAAAAEGVAEIRCEFCGLQYHFDADQIAELFKPHGIELEAPERLQ